MNSMHPIRCRCGAFQAELQHPERGTRAVCYCKDCQSFAHFLGLPAGMLDDQGGTDIVAVRPRFVRFTLGVEHLACMSLSERGTLRWYTSCCGTPIGNTPRDVKTSHVGLIHSCLDPQGSGLDRSFGPVAMRVSVKSAKGPVERNSPIRFGSAVLHYLGSLTWSRISGQYRVNPFFKSPQGTPRADPKVLSPAERAALLNATAPLHR